MKDMEGYTFSIRKYYADLYFVNDTGEKKDSFNKKWSHYGILHRLLNFLRSRGWCVMNDDSVDKIIRKDHFYGKKGNLEFVCHRYPRGFEFEFYQDIVFENAHGGKYDFDRFNKMPYIVKLVYLNETRRMKSFLESLGCVDISKPVYELAEGKIKQHFIESWHHPQESMDFKLSDLDGQTCRHNNGIDRDKKVIRNGEVKYFRCSISGRLLRGKVYHNINNMWWVMLNKYNYRNIADFELFDVHNFFGLKRLKQDKKPKEYLDKKEKLQQSSNKELLNELKRRGIKVS